MNIELDSKPVYDDNGKDVNTKVSHMGDIINTNFQRQKKYQKKMHLTTFCQ